MSVETWLELCCWMVCHRCFALKCMELIASLGQGLLRSKSKKPNSVVRPLVASEIVLSYYCAQHYTPLNMKLQDKIAFSMTCGNSVGNEG